MLAGTSFSLVSDHFFYVSKGCQPFIDFENGPHHTAHNHEHTEKVYGSEADDGVLVIKSGTDFRESVVPL